MLLFSGGLSTRRPARPHSRRHNCGVAHAAGPTRPRARVNRSPSHLAAATTLALVACTGPRSAPSPATEDARDTLVDAASDTESGAVSDASHDAVDAATDTRDTPAEPHDAPTDVPPHHDAELPGWCTNATDRATLQSTPTEDALAHCGATCGDTGEDTACRRSCLTDEIGLTAGCARCHATWVECASERCGHGCTPDPGAETCECPDAACRLEFQLCSGIAARPDPPELQHACGGEAEVDGLRNGTTLRSAALCRAICGTAATCFADCLHGDADVGPLCSACLFDYATCAAGACPTPCTDPYEAGCRACANALCGEALTECVGLELPWPTEPLIRYAEVRLLSLATSAEVFSVIRLPSGAPVFRTVEAGFVGDYSPFPAVDSVLAVTAGAVGPDAPILANLAVPGLEEHDRATIVVADALESCALAYRVETDDVPGEAVWRFFNGMPGASGLDVWLLGDWPDRVPLERFAPTVGPASFSADRSFDEDVSRRIGLDVDGDEVIDDVFAIWPQGLTLDLTFWYHAGPRGGARLLATSQDAPRTIFLLEDPP